MFMAIARWSSLLVISLISLFFAPTDSHSAFAAGNCVSDPNTYAAFDGQNAFIGGYGAMADIMTENSACCTGSSNSANTISAWALTVSNNDAYEYAQAGYLKRFGVDSTPYAFSEYRESESYNFVRHIWVSLGTLRDGYNWEYKTYYDTNASEEAMVVNGVNLSRTNFNPYDLWAGPWGQEWDGEVHDSGDEVPGTSSAPAKFTVVNYEPAMGGAFTTPFNEKAARDQGCQTWIDDSNFNIYHC